MKTASSLATPPLPAAGRATQPVAVRDTVARLQLAVLALMCGFAFGVGIVHAAVFWHAIAPDVAAAMHAAGSPTSPIDGSLCFGPSSFSQTPEAALMGIRGI